MSMTNVQVMCDWKLMGLKPKALAKSVIRPILQAIKVFNIKQETKDAIDSFIESVITDDDIVSLGNALKVDDVAANWLNLQIAKSDLFVKSSQSNKNVMKILEDSVSSSSKTHSSPSITNKRKRVCLLNGSNTSDDEIELINSTAPEMSHDSKLILASVNEMNSNFIKLQDSMNQLTQFCSVTSQKFSAYDEKFEKVDLTMTNQEARINDLNIKMISNNNDQSQILARFEERISQLEGRTYDGEEFNEDEEYVAMLGRTEDSRRKVDRLKNKIEVLLTDDSLPGLQLAGGNHSKASSTIDPAKMADLFRKTFGKTMNIVHCQNTFVRGKKNVCVTTLKYPSDATDMLKVRNKFKIHADSTRNNSIQRTLDKEAQKVYSHLIDLVKDNKLKEVSISKTGFICISVGNTFRMVLDVNEAWYIKRNGGISEDDLKNLKNGIKFVTSRKKLVNVPARYLREF